MINSNKDLHKRRANGTLCYGVNVKLKTGVTLTESNWDGYKVNSVCVTQTERITCECPRKSQDSPRKFFALEPESLSVAVSLPMFGNRVKIGGINVTQYGVNSNIATTGHKLQGMSKDNLIVVAWNYKTKNWV